MKTKLKIAADETTAAGLRSLIAKVNESDITLTSDDVQICAWLLECAREISLASCAHLSLVDHGNERVWPQRGRVIARGGRS